MAKQSKRISKIGGDYQTHIYLREEEYRDLETVAADQERSITAQVRYYVKHGLAADKRRAARNR